MSRNQVTSCSQTSLSRTEPSFQEGTQDAAAGQTQRSSSAGWVATAAGLKVRSLAAGAVFCSLAGCKGSWRVLSSALGQLGWVLPRTLALPGGQLTRRAHEESYAQLEKVRRLPPGLHVQK